jgi:hypothetical protein
LLRNEKRVAAYLVCVVIATGFWFLNALGKMYTVELAVPVKYYNFPNNKTFEGNLPNKFQFTVRAHGFTILRYRVGLLFGPLDFDVNEMTNDRMIGSKQIKYMFPTHQFFNELAYKMSSDIEILSMSPDTLFFGFGKTIQKKVKVKPVVKVNLQKQYQISGEIKASPGEILVTGPQSVIDTLHAVCTKMQEFENVSKTIRGHVEIAPMNNLFYNQRSVSLQIPVEEFTEKQMNVSISMTDVPPDVKIKLFPPKSKVSFLVGLSQFSEIRPENFKLAVSYSEVGNGAQRLHVKMLSTPPFLYDVKFSPEEIEYLIEK